ncbi:MAG: hypothetical protein V3V29_03770 [Acidimicrobiia bacterium]
MTAADERRMFTAFIRKLLTLFEEYLEEAEQERPAESETTITLSEGEVSTK